MAETINVLCYKSKTLSNGEHPLMIRICKNGKKKYVSLGLSVKTEHWNFEKNIPKPNCPNREHINILIANKKKEYEAEIVKLKSEDKLFTANTLNDRITSSVKPRTVEETFKEYISLLKGESRRGYMLSVQQVYNSLIKYNRHLDLYFTDLDSAWLKKYEAWLRTNGLAENTIGIRFRTLRTIYNYAIEKDIVQAEYYPFKKYKVSKLNQETAKRALSKEDIDKILHYQSKNRFMRLPIDLFAFTYYAGGINFVDIANLTKDNIIDNRIIYKRCKTGKLIKLPLTQQAKEIISKYHNPNSPYLFPIFSAQHITEQQKANRLHKVITNVNKRLKQIGEELKLPIPITTYVARHSQATIMKKAGVPTAIIGQIMGHSSERVTQIYLDSFDNEQINNAMKNLL
ncbi:site-specific integrase [Bacteroides caecigallinarum]|mgnify:FL=1|jgi:integrase|uniref:site-specific integrase n=1 Tax=Bacteroides caecigallinarum TaxID=1411144 RepID=UPI001F25568D|nr:site-specific integrase [Bacteroides caecigallinarum]MCF2737433.1 site-specific integrase [Bacteroides caecigallinarum]